MLLTVLLLAIHTLSAQPGRFGLPACDAPGQQLATRAAFVLCYSKTHNAPLWAAHQLTPDMLKSAPATRRHFRRDPDLPASATNADFRNSGFHRGHLVPAADLAFSPAALRESYYLSNAVPQDPEQNMSGWRRIENGIRKLAAQSDAVYILTGSLFDCGAIERIGPNQIAVPCATFKIALSLSGDSKSGYAVILPNRPAANQQVISIRELETRTGLDFFSLLPRTERDTLESTTFLLR